MTVGSGPLRFNGTGMGAFGLMVILFLLIALHISLYMALFRKVQLLTIDAETELV